jgi:hypothetical protein
VISAEVAVLADSVRVVGPISMRTLICQFRASPMMIAILTHAFCVERQRSVRTGSDYFSLEALNSLLFLLVQALSPASRQLSTAT